MELVKWSGWTVNVTADALMLSLSRDVAVYIHSLYGFRHFSHLELLCRLADRFGAARTLTDDKH